MLTQLGQPSRKIECNMKDTISIEMRTDIICRLSRNLLKNAGF
jgi:hypothetical protein